MSSKISALTPASEVSIVDNFVIVQSAANFKCTKSQILSAHSGEPMTLIGPITSELELDLAGGITLLETSGATITIWDGTTVFFGVDSSGTINIDVPSGSQIVLTSNGTVLEMDPSGNFSIVVGGTGSASYFYRTTLGPGTWQTASPVTIEDAIERIAVAVAGLLGGPIP
jgi:hypothetical protein